MTLKRAGDTITARVSFTYRGTERPYRLFFQVGTLQPDGSVLSPPRARGPALFSQDLTIGPGPHAYTLSMALPASDLVDYDAQVGLYDPATGRAFILGSQRAAYSVPAPMVPAQVSAVWGATSYETLYLYRFENEDFWSVLPPDDPQVEVIGYSYLGQTMRGSPSGSVQVLAENLGLTLALGELFIVLVETGQVADGTFYPAQQVGNFSYRSQSPPFILPPGLSKQLVLNTDRRGLTGTLGGRVSLIIQDGADKVVAQQVYPVAFTV